MPTLPCPKVLPFCGFSLLSPSILVHLKPHKVGISVRNIKEILNQPHKHYAEKNESILQIKELFEKADYLGQLNRRDGDQFDSFLFQTTIANEPSWILVRKYDRGSDYLIYSISDQSSLVSHLMKKEGS